MTALPHILLPRETADGHEIEIRVEFEIEPAESARLWRDDPEPGCPAVVHLYPPEGVTLTEDEVEAARLMILEEECAA